MKWKRWIVIASIAVVALLLATIIVLPPVARWYVEKHSEEWTGRKILMDDLGVNLFAASVTVKGLKILEQDGKEIFLAADEVYVNAQWWPLLQSKYELIEVSLQKPFVQVIQHGEAFNFDDVVKRFTAFDSVAAPPQKSEPVQYDIKNIRLADGQIKYINRDLKNEVKIVKLQAACPRVAWDQPQHRYTTQFSFDKGGDVKSVFDLSLDNLQYRLRYDMEAFNIGMLYPYAKDFINVSDLKGLTDAHVKVYGNFNEPQAIAASGTLALREFSLADPKKDTLVGLGALNIDVDTINIKADLYRFRGISMVKPYLKFELFDNENNFSRLVNYTSAPGDTTSTTAPDSTTVAVATGNIFELMANYIETLSEQYQVSNYKADSVVVRQGTLIFNDYTLHSRFNYLLENFYAKAEGISSTNPNIKAIVASTLNTSGKMTGEVMVDPKGFRNVEINYAVADLKITDFNPYSDYYVAHPFLDGICFYSNKSTIGNRVLKSENKLEIRKIIVGKKVKNSTAMNLPIRFAVALLRDVNGDIAIDIPVGGNLDDPKYKLGPVIWQIFKNLIAKAVAAPGKLLAKRSGVDEKDLEGFDWNPLQSSLDAGQQKALDAVAKTLASSPEMNVEFIKAYNLPKEQDELAVKESKKRFLFFNRRISSDEDVTPDEEKVVEAVPPKDSLFNAYVDNALNAPATPQSIFEKSKKLVGPDKIQRRLNRLIDERTAAILKYLVETKGVAENRFRIVDPSEPKKVAYETLSRTVMNFYLADEETASPAAGDN